jgi:hypothetical protein
MEKINGIDDHVSSELFDFRLISRLVVVNWGKISESFPIEAV